MRDLTEQMLLAKKGGVVQDGLRFWFDARDGAPVDRVANAQFVPHVEQYGNINLLSFTNGFLIYKPAIMHYQAAGYDLSMPIEGIRTVEVLIGEGTDMQQGTYIGSNDSITYWYTHSKHVLLRGYPYWYADRTISECASGTYDMCHIVAVFDNNDRNNTLLRLYRNGVPEHSEYGNVTRDYNFTITVNSAFRLVTQGTNHTYPIRIGSIRFYDRALTQDEVLKNMQYEISTGRLTV